MSLHSAVTRALEQFERIYAARDRSASHTSLTDRAHALLSLLLAIDTLPER